MKRISMIIVVALTLVLLAYAHSRTPKSTSGMPASLPQTASSTAKITAIQNRLNRYFQNAVIPKLKTPWKRVQGKGGITIKFTFTKAGSSWVPEKQEVKSSTLPKLQEAVALQHLRDSVRATSFPVEQGDASWNETAANRLVIYWSWPVPMPADGLKLAKPVTLTQNGPCFICDTADPTGWALCMNYSWGWADCDPGTPCRSKGDLCLGSGFQTTGTLIR